MLRPLKRGFYSRDRRSREETTVTPTVKCPGTVSKQDADEVKRPHLDPQDGGPLPKKGFLRLQKGVPKKGSIVTPPAPLQETHQSETQMK